MLEVKIVENRWDHIKSMMTNFGISLLSIVVALIFGIFFILLILTGLAFALPFRAGLINIGAVGQLLIGGFAAGVAGYVFTSLPGFIHLPLAILIGMLAGALWGGLPGLLKAKFGSNEVITTIMLNHIAIALTINYGINKLRTSSRMATPEIEPSAALLRFKEIPKHPIWGKLPFADIFTNPGIRLHMNFVLAIIAA